MIDYFKYIGQIKNLNKKYPNKFFSGIEIGYTQKTEKRIEEFLKDKFPICSNEKLELVKEIADLLEEDFDDFAVKYPYFSKVGRPQISNSHVTTIYIYNYGELKTYSYETLILYRNDVLYSRNENLTIVEKIQKQTSLFYGYKDIQDAERSLRQKAVEFL